MIYVLSTGRNKPALPPLWMLDPPRHPPASCGAGARTGTPVFDPSVGQKKTNIEVTPTNFPKHYLHLYTKVNLNLNVFREIHNLGSS